jgi:hypothetical protein
MDIYDAPDKSSISTCCACNWSNNLLFSKSGVTTPEAVSAIAAFAAAKYRAEMEKAAFWWTGTGERRRYPQLLLSMVVVREYIKCLVCGIARDIGFGEE